MRLVATALIALVAWTPWAAGAPIETAGPSLTEENWEDVKVGTWLIEHYSPYCGHCKAFAPKWKELVELREKDAGLAGFHFAQVDCAANGDLCHTNGVKYYPSIFLFVDGVIYDEYDGKREVELLSKYVDDNMPGRVVWLDDEGHPDSHRKLRAPVLDDKPAKEDVATPKSDEDDDESEEKLQKGESEGESPLFVEQPHQREKKGSSTGDSSDESSGAKRPDGKVHVLEAADVASLKTKGAGASFVKYYAPWCGHCKALAPKWEELAKELEGIAHIYEMDCDTSKTKKVCADEGVRAFPTLLFYNDGTSIEYKGKRDVKSLNHFALKAASATMTKVIANEYELKRAATSDDVVFLYLHSANTSKEDTSLAVEVSKVLLGGPPFYQSSSPDLFTLFNLDGTPTILVFKDHSLDPAETLSLPSSTLTPKQRREHILRWTRTAKLGIVTELNGETVGDLMPTDAGKDAPLVALAVLSEKGLGEKGILEAKANLASMAKEWKRMRKASPSSSMGKDVVWSWVDGDKWAGWARSLFDVKGGSKEAVLVVSDVQAMEYWRTSLDGESQLGLADGGAAAFTLIEQGIHTGAVPGKSSKNYVERWGAKIAKHTGAARSAFNDHPLLLLVGVAALGAGLLYAVRWSAGAPPRLSAGGTYPREVGGAKRE